jgi:ferredoxin
MLSVLDIEALLQPAGLILRGGFHPAPADDVPRLAHGAAAQTVLMIGNAGTDGGDPMWRAFAAQRHAFDGANPLDDWTRSFIDRLAHEAGAEARYPFGGPPYLPFQRWAMRAEPVFASPLGLLVHPVYGLWHGYRAALIFAESLPLPVRDDVESPCADCAKPCLTACPVGAFARKGYDADACADHVASAAGADCLDRGCRARLACPVAPTRAPVPDQSRFHMEAFLRGVRRR